MKKLKNVVSLFDGKSCGQIALEIEGFEVENYFASEIDKSAIKVTKANYPNTIHIGSVTDINYIDGHVCAPVGNYEVGEIDLLIGGSPCQNFSFAGSRKGMVTKDNVEILTLDQYLELKANGFEFQGQSFLFWEYVRLLKECQPKYFLLENVKMSKKWQDLISSILGVEPILINSALVSAQNRQRLYWTNIPNIEQPEDRGILLKDILEDLPWREIIPTFYKNWGNKQRIDKSVNHIVKDKSTCLTTKSCHTSQYLFNEDFSKMRMLSLTEFRRLQTIPDYILMPVTKTESEKLIGNGWTVEVIAYIFSKLNPVNKPIKFCK